MGLLSSPGSGPCQLSGEPLLPTHSSAVYSMVLGSELVVPSLGFLGSQRSIGLCPLEAVAGDQRAGGKESARSDHSKHGSCHVVSGQQWHPGVLGAAVGRHRPSV
jgi:hypothetical protein